MQQIYTSNEFVRASFPDPNFNEDKFSGPDTPDTIICRGENPGASKCAFFLVTESTARLYQLRMEGWRLFPNMQYMVATKGTVSASEWVDFLSQHKPDAFIADIAAFTDEHARDVRAFLMRPEVPKIFCGSQEDHGMESTATVN